MVGSGLCAHHQLLASHSFQTAIVPAPPCRSLEVDGKPASLARAGDSADVTLAGVEASALCAGSVLCHPDFPVPLVDK